MKVTLEAIKFNHRANSATNDGFSIRHNENRHVLSPEWQLGTTQNSEDAPAAYALDQISNNTLTIQARITCSDPTVTSIWIRTLDGNIFPEKPGISRFARFALSVFRPLIRAVVQPNILGVVTAKEVKPSSGPDDFQDFELAGVRLPQAGVGVNEIIWRWQFSTDGSDWTDIATTRHRIYSVFKLPTGAWQPNSNDPSNNQLPWTEVLEYACRWGAGAQDERAIAAQITSSVNLLGPAFIEYDNASAGSTHYTYNDPPTFDCQRFLNLLNGASTEWEDKNVNCDDCAAMVSSFVCILGYGLPVSAMKPVNPPKFFLRSHKKIGAGDFDPIDSFFHHTVAWQGGEQDEVSDACIALDTNESGVGLPVALLAANLPFGIYRHLLAVDENCMFTEKSTVFRCVGTNPTVCSATEPDTDLEQTKRNFDHDKWRETSKESFLEPKLVFKKGELFEGWVTRSARFVRDDLTEYMLSRTEGANEDVVRIDARFARTSNVEETLLRLLDHFEKPGVKYREKAGLGDNAFADDSGFVIVFSRFNLIVLMRNITKRPRVLWGLAQFIDKSLLEKQKVYEQ